MVIYVKGKHNLTFEGKDVTFKDNTINIEAQSETETLVTLNQKIFKMKYHSVGYNQQVEDFELYKKFGKKTKSSY